MHGSLRVLLFVIVGPFVGLLAISVIMGLVTLATTGSSRDLMAFPGTFQRWVLIGAYLLGLGPALLTGLASTYISHWHQRAASWSRSALVGAVVSLVLGFVLLEIMTTTGEPGPDGPQMLTELTLTGAIAGFACSALCDALETLLDGRKASG